MGSIPFHFVTGAASHTLGPDAAPPAFGFDVLCVQSVDLTAGTF